MRKLHIGKGGRNGKRRKRKEWKVKESETRGKEKVLFRDFFFVHVLPALLAQYVCIIEFVVYTFVTC